MASVTSQFEVHFSKGLTVNYQKVKAEMMNFKLDNINLLHKIKRLITVVIIIVSLLFWPFYFVVIQGDQLNKGKR